MQGSNVVKKCFFSLIFNFAWRQTCVLNEFVKIHKSFKNSLKIWLTVSATASAHLEWAENSKNANTFWNYSTYYFKYNGLNDYLWCFRTNNIFSLFFLHFSNFLNETKFLLFTTNIKSIRICTKFGGLLVIFIIFH